MKFSQQKKILKSLAMPPNTSCMQNCILLLLLFLLLLLLLLLLFFCSYDNFLLTNDFFLFGNQILKWYPFEKKITIFDPLFREKYRKFLQHISCIHICILLTILGIFASPILRKMQIHHGFSLV